MLDINTYEACLVPWQWLLRILPTEENAMTVDDLSQKVNCNQEYARRCVTELHDEHECRRKKRKE